MPSRSFSPYDLTHGITSAAYHAMSDADKLAFDRALTALWVSSTTRADALFLAGDYDLIGSNRRFEIGQ